MAGYQIFSLFLGFAGLFSWIFKIQNINKLSRLVDEDKFERKRLLEFYGDECSICGMGSSWNGKNLVLVLDHIDGDASNNNSANIRFVCPNCDSQLDTFKSKNKKSARSFRRNK